MLLDEDSVQKKINKFNHSLHKTSDSFFDILPDLFCHFHIKQMDFSLQCAIRININEN